MVTVVVFVLVVLAAIFGFTWIGATIATRRGRAEGAWFSMAGIAVVPYLYAFCEARGDSRKPVGPLRRRFGSYLMGRVVVDMNGVRFVPWRMLQERRSRSVTISWADIESTNVTQDPLPPFGSGHLTVRTTDGLYLELMVGRCHELREVLTRRP